MQRRRFHRAVRLADSAYQSIAARHRNTQRNIQLRPVAGIACAAAFKFMLQIIPDELDFLAVIVFGHRVEHLALGDLRDLRPHHVSHRAAYNFQDEDRG